MWDGLTVANSWQKDWEAGFKQLMLHKGEGLWVAVNRVRHQCDYPLELCTQVLDCEALLVEKA